jgi:hypothetical protein
VPKKPFKHTISTAYAHNKHTSTRPIIILLKGMLEVLVNPGQPFYYYMGIEEKSLQESQEVVTCNHLKQDYWSIPIPYNKYSLPLF